MLAAILAEETDLGGKLFMVAWMAIGLTVAYFFNKQQFEKSDHDSGRSFRFVMLVLALMWPIILLAIVANYYGDDNRKKKNGEK